MTFDITHAIPVPLGREVAESSEGGDTLTVSSRSWDCALGGLGWLMAPSEKVAPYQRETTPWRKEQFDPDRHAGEQTLDSGWWLRSQLSFHGGAGLKYMEPAQDDFSNIRFDSSAGLDVSTPGEVRLLRTMALDEATGSGEVYVLGGQVSSADAYWVLEAAVDLERKPSSTTITGFFFQPSYLATNGSKIYAGRGGAVESLDVGDNASDGALWTSADLTAMRPWWAKQRLFITRANKVWQVSPAGGDLDTETPIYEHPQSGWTWTSLTETPGGVFIAGYSGGRSSIHVIAVDTNTGEIPTITGATVAATMPEGEVVHALYGYGSYLAIGTNRGVRLAVVEGVGLQYGPLLFETDGEPVRCFTARGSFIWAGVTNFIDGKSGAVRLDLGVELGNELLVPWTADVSTGVTGTVDSIAQYGNSGRLVIGVRGSGAYLESATNLVSEGYLRTGWIRYNTLERKRFIDMMLRFEEFTGGSVSISAIDRNGSEVTLSTVTPDNDFSERIRITNPRSPQERMAFRFTFRRDEVDATLGPAFAGYQARATPAVRKTRTFQVPLVCFDRETDRLGQRQGRKGDAYVRLTALEGIERDAAVTTWQDFRTGETRQVQIESLKFINTEPPSGHVPNFGGFVLASLRTVD